MNRPTYLVCLSIPAALPTEFIAIDGVPGSKCCVHHAMKDVTFMEIYRWYLPLRPGGLMVQLKSLKSFRCPNLGSICGRCSSVSRETIVGSDFRGSKCDHVSFERFHLTRADVVQKCWS